MAMLVRPSQRLVIGLMSGTSADGVDAALLSLTLPGSTACEAESYVPTRVGHIDGTRILADGTAMKLLAYTTIPFPVALRARIFTLREGSLASKLFMHELCELSATIATEYAAAAFSVAMLAGISMASITAIGAHGLTVFHLPPLTLQLLDAPLLASLTNCDVVHDMRRADCAAGGQGAPLVPMADVLLWGATCSGTSSPLVLVNVGGVANITVISGTRVIAFDTGPAMCISDAIVRRAQIDAGYDDAGAMAAHGYVNANSVRAILSAGSTYFNRAPPKSCDVPQLLSLFDSYVEVASNKPIRDLDSGDSQSSSGAQFQPSETEERQQLTTQRTILYLHDALATALALTAETLARGVIAGVTYCAAALPENDSASDSPFVSTPTAARVVVSGGGAMNATLLEMLRIRLGISGANESCNAVLSYSAAFPRPRDEPAALTFDITDNDGIPSAAKEAVAWALLADLSLARRAGNVPSCTGARSAVVLGSIALSPHPRC